MFRVKLPNIEVDISFTHPRVKRIDRYSKEQVELRGTCCYIYTVTENISRLVVTGRATCDDRDNFCRKEGRKLALARALKCSYLTRQERTAIWQAYNLKWGYLQKKGQPETVAKVKEESSDRTETGSVQESIAS